MIVVIRCRSCIDIPRELVVSTADQHQHPWRRKMVECRVTMQTLSPQSMEYSESELVLWKLPRWTTALGHASRGPRWLSLLGHL